MNNTPLLLEELEQFRADKSSFDYVMHRALAERSLDVRVLILHSSPHERWAGRLEMHMKQAFPDLFPGINVTFEKKMIYGTRLEVEEQICDDLDLNRCLDMNEYSFIITTGEWESNMIHTIREMAGCTVPQLYCIPNVPVSLELPLTTRRRNCPLSGVFSKPTNPTEYLHAARALLPDVAKVCFLIEDEDDLCDDDVAYSMEHRALQQCFNEAGIKVIKHYWTADDPRLIELEKCAQEAEVFMLFNQPSAHAHIKSVRAICKKYEVILCSSELDSVLDGAAIGAGVTGASFSPPLLSLMADVILLRNIYLSAPIRIPQQFGLHYNFDAMREQGLKISDELSALLRMRSVFDKDITEY
ncbi:MAG: hypothetical protein QG604_702 [Candidatus Dependentiae bacterium]|nr:hypothetical protein [Candidatus Dependentiae bacterium]